MIDKEKNLLRKIQDATYYRKKALLEFINAAKDAEQDSENEDRLLKKLCLYCYYLRKNTFAGAAITHNNCYICTKEMIFSSTDTDLICAECAKKHKLCKKCLSDIEFKPRRKV